MQVLHRIMGSKKPCWLYGITNGKKYQIWLLIYIYTLFLVYILMVLHIFNEQPIPPLFAVYEIQLILIPRIGVAYH